MSQEKKPLKEAFGKIAKTLAKIGLPALGTAIGGPAGGILAGTLGSLLGVDAQDTDAIDQALANASPETLVKLREIEASVALAKNETDQEQIAAVKDQWVSDNASGYWLPANTRPIVILSLLAFYMVWTIATTGIVLWFYAVKGTIDEALTSFLMAIALQIVGFLTTTVLAYFGARSYDKRNGVAS